MGFYRLCLKLFIYFTNLSGNLFITCRFIVKHVINMYRSLTKCENMERNSRYQRDWFANTKAICIYAQINEIKIDYEANFDEIS